MKYTPEIVARLHDVLFEIIEEIGRVCRALDIKCFGIGGTAIGVHFWQNILPWDDDADFGMLREDYEKFLTEGPALLGDDFEIQEFRTEPNTPFYWTKVRKRNTLFLEDGFESFEINHGIFIDIFPFDRIPSGAKLQAIHRAKSAWLISAFSLRPFWERRNEIPRKRSLYYRKSCVSRVVLGVMYRLTSREWLYRKMCKEVGRFNKDDRCRLVNVVRLPLDVAEYDSVRNPKEATFGRLTICVPRDLDAYLHHHYPVLVKDIPDEQKVTHAPLKLSFDTIKEQTYE